MAWLDFIPILGDLTAAIRKAVPDTAERDRIAGELEKAQIALAQAQAEMTATDAASSDPFRTRWRPAIGWICVAGIGLHFLVFPLTSLTLQLLGQPGIASPLDIGSLMAIVASLLGLGGLRTFERVKGKA